MLTIALASVALLYGLATATMPAPRAALEPESGSLDCAGLRARVEAWRATPQPPVRVRVRATTLAVLGAADSGMRGTFLCGDDVWPASFLVTAGAPGERMPLDGDTTVTIEMERDALQVLQVCANCGERGIRKRHVRTPAEVEAQRPLGYVLTALSSATLLGLLVWWILRRRRSADGFVD